MRAWRRLLRRLAQNSGAAAQHQNDGEKRSIRPRHEGLDKPVPTCVAQSMARRTAAIHKTVPGWYKLGSRSSPIAISSPDLESALTKGAPGRTTKGEVRKSRPWRI